MADLSTFLLSDEVDLIRSTANALSAFKFERRTSEQWSKFWGCLDTLRDMDEAAFELLKVNRKPTRAECFGFLQILVSQQDAIYHLSKSVGLENWKPVENADLQIIRDLRNRITSHSAWADKSYDGVKSTSMINWTDIREGGFKAVVYREIEDKSHPLYEDVNFQGFLETNIQHLKLQVKDILKKMNNSEDVLKRKMQNLDWTFWDNQGDGYLFEKLWSPWRNQNDRMDQAKFHIEIFFERLVEAKKFFERNAISEISEFELSALLAGCLRLKKYLDSGNPDEGERLQYYVLLVGWKKLWVEFDDQITVLMGKFSIER